MTQTEPSWNFNGLPDSDSDGDIKIIDVKPASRPTATAQWPVVQTALKRKPALEDDKPVKKVKMVGDRAEDAIRTGRDRDRDRVSVVDTLEANRRRLKEDRAWARGIGKDRTLAQDEIKAVREGGKKVQGAAPRLENSSSLTSRSLHVVSKQSVQPESTSKLGTTKQLPKEDNDWIAMVDQARARMQDEYKATSRHETESSAASRESKARSSSAMRSQSVVSKDSVLLGSHKATPRSEAGPMVKPQNTAVFGPSQTLATTSKSGAVSRPPNVKPSVSGAIESKPMLQKRPESSPIISKPPESKLELPRRTEPMASAPPSITQSPWSDVTKDTTASTSPSLPLPSIQAYSSVISKLTAQNQAISNSATPLPKDAKLKISSTPPIASRAKPIFLEVSDSEDEMDTSDVQPAQSAQLRTKARVESKKLSVQDLEYQREESNRMRQSALEKRHSVTPGSATRHEPAGVTPSERPEGLDTLEKTTPFNEQHRSVAPAKRDDGKTKKSGTSSLGKSLFGAAISGKKADEWIAGETRPQLHRAQQSSTAFQKALSDIESTPRKSESTSNHVASSHLLAEQHGANGDQIPSSVEHSPMGTPVRGDTSFNKAQASAPAPPQAVIPKQQAKSASNLNPDGAITEAEGFKARRAENQRKRNEQLAASIKANGDVEKKEKQDERDAELKAAKEKEKEKAELKQLKEAADHARKEADDKREAERQRREAEKKQEQERQWREGQKARERTKESYRKNHQQAKIDDDAATTRSSIATLLGVIPPLPKSEKPKIDTPANVETVAPARSISKASASSGVDRTAKTKDINQDKEPTAEAREKASADVANKETVHLSDLARAQRIQAKKERNAKLHDAENDDNESIDDVEQPVLPAFKPLARGPVSLNSAAGQALLARANTQPNAEGSKRNPNRGRTLGEILPQDVQMVVWHDAGRNFQEITYLLEKQFGYSRNWSTIRKRIFQVRGALLAAVISAALIERVISGDHGARMELNTQVHGQWPPPGMTSCSKVNSNSHPQYAGISTPTHVVSYTNANSPLHLPETFSRQSGTSTTLTSPAYDFQQPTAAGERPRVGGKTINADFLKYHMDVVAHAREEIQDEAEAAKEEAILAHESSPISPHDRNHFAYQVERRFISIDEISYGKTIEDQEPIIRGNAYDSLAQANAEAAREILRNHQGEPEIVIPGEFQLNSCKPNQGCAVWTLDNCDVGQLAVCVKRFERSHQDAILPTSKEGWAPRTVYCIKQRNVEKKQERRVDELFGDEEVVYISETNTERLVERPIYTTLEQANSEAASYFVEKSVRAKSTDVAIWWQQKQGLLKELLEKFDHEEGKRFYKRIEDDDKVMEVWVEACGLAGPRNIF